MPNVWCRIVWYRSCLFPLATNRIDDRSSSVLWVAVCTAGLNGDRALINRESWARLPGAELYGDVAQSPTVKARRNKMRRRSAKVGAR